MGDAEAFLRALTWFSPAFPTGAFAYSHGLEQAVDRGLVASAADLEGLVRRHPAPRHRLDRRCPSSS